MKPPPKRWWVLRRLGELSFVDLGPREATTFIAGMGRSGTTWVANLINHDFTQRILFEPFRPTLVREASVFTSYQYIRPSDRDPVRLAAAQKILSGRTRRGTADRGHRGFVFRRRIVKEVRCNLMLGWLRAIRPTMPIVIVVRNPFAVAASWLRLEWGNVAWEGRPELDIILEQEALLADFPLIRRTMAEVDRSDPFERVLYQWCLVHLVPLQQIRSGEALWLFYEDLLSNPGATLDRLSGYLRVPIQGPGRDRALDSLSSTTFRQRDVPLTPDTLLTSWQTALSVRQIERGHEILEACGLGRLYDDRGRPVGGLG